MPGECVVRVFVLPNLLLMGGPLVGAFYYSMGD